jgi:SAM-dependent methyltransferase
MDGFRCTVGDREIASLEETPAVSPQVTFLAAGERDLRTAVVYPADHVPGTQLPVLLDPYGGPGAQRVLRSRAAFLTSQWLADQGFAVVVIDGRGTPGRGPVWERSVLGDLATPPLEDQVDGLLAVAAGHPDLDLGRVAIRGWSFGGFLAALAVLRAPDVFHAAVAGAPVTDWRLYDTHYTERYLGHPHDAPDAYAVSSLIDEQVDYYRARAPEYDTWWFREGSYDLGPGFNAQWAVEVEAVERVVDEFAPTGDVLELAAGTGLWSRELVRYASSLTSVDASPETLAINRTRTASSGVPVEYVEADLFSWSPTRRYDVVFFSFWLSHVPPDRFEWFWSLVDDALVPGGRVLFLDNAAPFEAIAPEFPQLLDEGRVRAGMASNEIAAGVSERRLEDGRTFHVVKVFYEPSDLQARLEGLGWSASVSKTATFFLYGSAALHAARA